MTETPLLLCEEAAKILRTSPRRLRILADKREIGHIRDGRLYKFTQQDIDNYLQSKRQIVIDVMLRKIPTPKENHFKTRHV